ncbi:MULTISPECIES: hypothetical protein [unclassified Polaribacter]|uniref:hypothetical protein n=1 Tax=unclassified Polaribacter TaxID=196858 RepID=UPI0021D0E912|nr:MULTISPECIES: hypothetical protein [unclassified Polaribacter]
MSTAKEVQQNLEFLKVENGFISYQLKNNATNDSWKTIVILYNAKNKPMECALQKSWNIAILGNHFYFDAKNSISKKISIPAILMAILFEE